MGHVSCGWLAKLSCRPAQFYRIFFGPLPVWMISTPQTPSLPFYSCVGGSASPPRLPLLQTDDESTVASTANLPSASHLLCGEKRPALRIVRRRRPGSTCLPPRQLGVQFKGPFRELSPMRRTHNWHPSCLIKVQSAGMDSLSQVSAPSLKIAG